jgi:Tfp pilus assembly protein PilV
MHKRAPNSPGFSLIDVIIALVILSVGLLSLAATGALVTRMIARSQRSTLAATAAGRRLEHLRASACLRRDDGSEVVQRGGMTVARNEWRWSVSAAEQHRLVLLTTYAAAPGRWRTDTLGATIACVK